ncbi:All-trans-nonaprenyl-diphosphate synthase (geranyl-diphosphate specific) [Corynebacterium occultum]|uniref:All-trans-nonaprenyl-diphosphate synthase (Geranyl-diphosphate specific) n=1 Tax=Corynebacterium occultum TaxID=2675219 RepID=A0A6B8WBL3_9CORY|nr:polyprenyl synthetase family protein [Corynebacterium occultum]QGU07410.1 All-trans-nonaprenyl-diphosphate synthase (geranyl-diphosphate specific) [Corynebacterium occultum]
MSVDVEARVTASLALLEDFLNQGRKSVASDARLLNMAYEGVAVFALGGKHLRSRLVHISAGEVSGQGLYAATVFGACVDLLHGAFLIQDDIIDRDDTRRGKPTIHAAVRDEFGDAHMGISLAIVAGDLGINGALQLLLNSHLEDALVRHGMRLLSAAAQETITGEILDIAHLTEPKPDLEQVRLSNHLKTSEYSFGTPLKLGALAAGRDPAPMKPIAHALGCAYQAADDIAGAIGDSAVTGKTTGGDVINGRATLMTTRMEGQFPTDPAQLDAIIQAVIKEGDTHLAQARRIIDDTDLAEGVREGLHHVTDTIEGMLRTHA